jgi:transposase
MAFGGTGCPQGNVVRTFRTKVMSTNAKKARAFALLVAAGDVWAWVIDRFHVRAALKLPNANGLCQLWPDQKAHGPFGELTAHCAQDVTKAWSVAFFAATRKRAVGENARLPLRKRRLVSVRWRKGEFRVHLREDGRRPRVELSTRRGTGNLVLALAKRPPYPPETIREVRLLAGEGELYLDFTAYVEVTATSTEHAQVAGIDLGIIHPLAASSGKTALLVSGRALRAEEFLHLEDTKQRQRRQARLRSPQRKRPGSPARAGSRRWKKIARSQRKKESRNRRLVRQGLERVVRLALPVVSGAGKVAIGDPRGVTRTDTGRVHNRRSHRWAVGVAMKVISYRLEELGYAQDATDGPGFYLLDERGTSSRCPICGSEATKSGRSLSCSSPTCRRRHHRDVAGSQSIAQLLGAAPVEIALIEHRRVGTPARRDRRRQLYDERRRSSVVTVLPVPGPLLSGKTAESSALSA